MKTRTHLRNFAILSTLVLTPMVTLAQNVQATANNIKYPLGLTNWRVIGSSMRNDNNTQRVILGNSIAIKAGRANTAKTQWPDGAILAKLVWKNTTLESCNRSRRFCTCRNYGQGHYKIRNDRWLGFCSLERLRLKST
ncbi:hypothetical protein BMR03_07260 [Methylococcaceae bacterium HT2]|nr:hypothetical protein BMR03_07260 [Methylococcaceae bacterium HT2]